ncbi:Hypothetical protein SMAX5B_007884 [Scophthalmus maximus]|uniref:Uncharacterized protein n=1 Tax=Scophthalmus maximus TaxID=52904 RepID=A0A2U9C6Y5_SCOMX|nr:Hypothetical protein SMAX5B_007884 [Scophthalmus maximus]
MHRRDLQSVCVIVSVDLHVVCDLSINIPPRKYDKCPNVSGSYTCRVTMTSDPPAVTQACVSPLGGGDDSGRPRRWDRKSNGEAAFIVDMAQGFYWRPTTLKQSS